MSTSIELAEGHEKEPSEAVNSIDNESLTSSRGKGDVPFNPSLERKVWGKMDLFILPVVAMMSLLSSLDRTNIGNARVAGLQNALHMTNNQYSIALTIFTIPYLLAELPSNLLLRIIGANIMLPTMLTLWGLVTMCQGFVDSYPGLLACRWCLGMMEGGILPACILYLSEFYPREKLHLRVSIIIAFGGAFSSAFSGLLAFAIVHMDGQGGKPGWAWIFILEGLFSSLLGFCFYFILPQNSDMARFLSSAEKGYVTQQLTVRGASAGLPHDDSLTWRGVLQSLKEVVFRSPQVLLIGIMSFPGGTTVGGLAYFAPSIVQTFGYSPTRTQLMTVPPFAVAFVVSVLVAWLSDRYHRRGVATVVMTTCCIVGLAMFLWSTNLHVQYASLFFSITGVFGSAPTLSAWTANNAAPHIRRATAIAFVWISATGGTILSLWLLAGDISPPPRYTKATIVLMVLQIVELVTAIVTIFYLDNQNKKKAARRMNGRREDEDPNLGNRSAWFIYTL